MKRKIFPLLLLTVFTLCLSSCHGKTTDTEAATEQDSSAKNEETGTGGDTKQESEQKDCLLYYETGDNSVGSMYLIDENGNKKRYLSDTVQEVLEKNNLASAVKDGLQAQYLYINEIVYVRFYGGLDDNDNRVGLYAIDPDNGRLVKVTDNGEIDYIDYYNGKLYVGFYGNEKNTESVFTVSDDFSFIQGESEYVEALKKIGEYYIKKTPYKESDGYHIAKAGFSPARAFDEAGYIMATRYGQTGKNEYIKILPDGTAEAIECLSDGLREILYYDKDIVYCTGTYSSDTEVYSVDISTGNSKLILDDIGIGYRQVADNKLLHSDRKGENLYVFDLKKKEDKQLYPLKNKAGVSIYDSFRCQIINGKVFVCDLKDAELKWFRVGGHDDNKSGYIVDDIDCPIEVVGAYKYGTVTKFESEMNCPSCGAVILNHSYELFQLNEEYSKHASVINEKLKEKKDDFINTFSEDELDCVVHWDGECIDEKLYYLGGESEESLYDVDIVNSRFLVLNMNYWWYGGGPHGLTHDDIYVFDLSTGEELSLKNFYSGTESEFKDLIAGKIKEDYCKCPGIFEMNSEEDAYNWAYGAAYIDSTSIYYYGDHITYCFNQYELGSYAAGIYEVSVSYEELNGHAELTRMK